MRRATAFAERLPTRVRVTLAFTLVMAILLAGLGLFLYVRLGTTLDNTIDRGLRTRADDVATLVREADSGLSQAGRSPLTERGENVAQILDANGRVVDAPPALRKFSLLHRTRATIGPARVAVNRRPVWSSCTLPTAPVTRGTASRTRKSCQ